MNEVQSRSRAREFAVQSILLIALLACVFPTVFLQGELLVPGGLLFDFPPWSEYRPETFEPLANKQAYDALAAFHMYYVLCRRAMDSGEWPLWNHLEFTGMPLLANYQSAIFYPPRLLHSALDVSTATTLFILLNLWLCGINAYFCGKGLGLGIAASRFLSIAWMLSSYNLIWCYWPLPSVSAWFPLMVLGVEWTVSMRLRRGFAVLLVSATMMLLGGHPESAFGMGLAAGAMFFTRLAFARAWGTRLWKPIAAAGAAWAVALALCAVQLLPFFEYLANSYHFYFRPSENADAHSLPFGALALFWVPRFFGTSPEGTFWLPRECSNFTNLVYPGLAVWFGVALTPFAWRAERARLIAWAASAILCILFAFNYSAFQFILRLPVFSSTWNIYYVGPAVFLIQVLGAAGLKYWLADKRDVRQALWMAVPIVAVAVFIGGLYAFNQKVLAMQGRDTYVLRQIAFSVAIAGICFVALSLRTVWRRRAVSFGIVTAALAVDLIVAVRPFIVASPREHLFVQTELTDFLIAEQPARVMIPGGSLTGLLAIYGIEEWLGYDGILPLRHSRFLRVVGESMWKGFRPALGVQYFLQRAGSDTFTYDQFAPGSFEKAGSMDGLDVYRDKELLPRVFLVGSVEVLESLEAVFDRLTDETFDPRQTVLLEHPIEHGPAPNGGEAGSALLRSRTANEVEIEVNASAQCMLVLADAYYPGWTAQVDGKAAPVYPAYGVFRAIVVPEGTHEVRFRYRPLSFLAGIAISSVALLVAAIAAIRLLVPCRGRT